MLRLQGLLVALTLCAFTPGDDLKDRLGVPGPLSFNKTDFQLAWSDQPNKTYTLQEYLPEGQKLESYQQMLALHVFERPVTLKDAVGQKVMELEERKLSDPVCNYEVTNNPDKSEYIVDFLMGESKEGRMNLVEFNIYHYRLLDQGKGRRFVVIYAYTKRSYGEEVTSFLKGLRDERTRLLNEMISSAKPSIRLN